MNRMYGIHGKGWAAPRAEIQVGGGFNKLSATWLLAGLVCMCYATAGL
jgi:hypothetical protein